MKNEKISFGKRQFFVDFDFHRYFKHERQTGRFDFQQPLFAFLDLENKNLKDDKKWMLYLSLTRCDKDPFFEFDEVKEYFL